MVRSMNDHRGLEIPLNIPMSLIVMLVFPKNPLNYAFNTHIMPA